MTPQPHTHTYPDARGSQIPDARIDQVLNALRTTVAPEGLEERIAARLAQAAEARTQSAASAATPARTARSIFAVILNAVKSPLILPTPARIFTATATALALLTMLTVLHYRTTALQTNATSAFNRETPSAATTQVAQDFSLGSHSVHQEAGVLTPAISQAPRVRIRRGFVFGSRNAEKSSGMPIPASTPQRDPDAIALAETLAPSLAAPPMPLTPQEQLIASATRPGQPIQLAELDTARQPYLRAEANSRTDAAIARYVHALLAPFAVADALQPSTAAEPREISTSAPAPQPHPSLSN